MPSCGTAAAVQAAQLISLPLKLRQRRLKFSAGFSARPAATTDASTASPNKLLHNVCRQHGIHLDPSLQLARTQWGLGLCRQHTHQQQLPVEQHSPLVEVPLDLVLSCSIPGCSPRPDQLSPELQQLLHSSAVNQSWEMQVAVLLLWALRQPPESRISSFWRRYRPLLPGTAQDCSSLLVWSESELQELQDPSLQVTAQQWQQTVHKAYHTAVQPFFNSLAACNRNSSSSNELSQAGTSDASGQPCSLQDWLWAVASVESRAFGVARADAAALAEGSSSDSSSDSSSSSSRTGWHNPQASAAGAAAAGQAAELTGLVPVLDLANHAIRPQYEHRADPTTGSFSLFLDGMLAQQQQRSQQPGGLAGAPSTLVQSVAENSSRVTAQHAGQQHQHQVHEHEQVLITYGSKSNRQLMEQYGFVVPGNPLDRISFPSELLQEQHGWMSHKAVKAAALQILQQQEQQHAPDVLQLRTDAAVASILQYRGWKNAQQYKATTPASTALCAQIMLTTVQQQLQVFPTTAAADSAQLQQLAETADTTVARLQAALRYRLEQKLLLQAAADVLLQGKHFFLGLTQLPVPGGESSRAGQLPGSVIGR